MSRRASPFARLRREADREAASQPAHLRHLTPHEQVQRIASDALAGLRRGQRQDGAPERDGELERVRRLGPLAGVSDGGWLLVKVLVALEGAAEVAHARVGFLAAREHVRLVGDPSFEAALAGLAEHGLVTVGASIGPDGAPGRDGVIALRRDVELPDPPQGG